MSTIIDDRKDRMARPWLVVGTDRVLSGWGVARGGLSYAAWACTSLREAEECERAVRGRTDMLRVRVVKDCPGRPYRPGARCAHLHIYAHPYGKPVANE